MAAIGASHFDGFNDMFYHVAAIVDRGKGAEGTLVQELVVAGRTYGMPHSALTNINESVNMIITLAERNTNKIMDIGIGKYVYHGGQVHTKITMIQFK
jgi:hypothetical protein